MGHTKLIPQKTTINCKGKLLSLHQPLVMGIVNITPDSFFSGSRFAEADVLRRVEQIVQEGGDIVDLGAYSSRPGAEHISANDEWLRLEPVLNTIRTKYPNLVLSVDTFRAEVAEKAVQNYNVDMINDISAGELDADMFAAIAQLQVPYILMHMKGTPQTMQTMAHYKDLMREVIHYFSSKLRVLKALGVHDLIIDPGFGFGKTKEHNFHLLAHLDEFKVFGEAMLVGLSRKSMIYKELGVSPEEALNGTTVLHTIALQKGANILRVHDVKQAKESIILANATLQHDV